MWQTHTIVAILVAVLARALDLSTAQAAEWIPIQKVQSKVSLVGDDILVTGREKSSEARWYAESWTLGDGIVYYEMVYYSWYVPSVYSKNSLKKWISDRFEGKKVHEQIQASKNRNGSFWYVVFNYNGTKCFAALQGVKAEPLPDMYDNYLGQPNAYVYIDYCQGDLPQFDRKYSDTQKAILDFIDRLTFDDGEINRLQLY